MRKAVVGGVVVTATAALVGGASLIGIDSDERKPEARTTSATPPLNAYLPTPKQEAILNKAASQGVDECMQRYGFKGTGVVSDVWILEIAGRSAPLFIPVGVAKAHGYHDPPKPDPAGSANPESTPENLAAESSGKNSSLNSDAEKETYRRLMNGWVAESGTKVYRGKSIPKSGCLGEADAALMKGTPRPRRADSGDPANSTEVLNITLHLISEAKRRAKGDSGYQDMVAEWRTCMKDSGHDYETPEAARRAWVEKPTPSARERHVAAQDTRCKTEVGYVPTVARLEQSTQQQLIKENAAVLDLVEQNIDARVAKAKKLVSDDSAR